METCNGEVQELNLMLMFVPPSSIQGQCINFTYTHKETKTHTLVSF